MIYPFLSLMALAVTHVILTIVLLDLFRHYVFGLKKFPRYLLVVGGIAGLFPDIDIPLTWLYNFFMKSNADFHGTFTHSLVFPLIFLIIGLALYFQKNEKIKKQFSLVYRYFINNEKKWAKISFVIAAGWLLHLVLDCAYGGYKTLFWPWGLSTNFCPLWNLDSYATYIDAVILVLWLVHEEVHHYIKDYF